MRANIIFAVAALVLLATAQPISGAGRPASRNTNQRRTPAQRVSSAASATNTYTVRNVQQDGLKVSAKLDLTRDRLLQYGPSFDRLDVLVEPQTDSRLRVKVAPLGVRRWEVPESIVPRPSVDADLSADSLMYEVEVPKRGQGFTLNVTRSSNGQPMFDTTGHTFVFKDQYTEITTNVPKDADLYGLGEVTLKTGLLLPRDGTVVTLWARDLSPASAGFNLYGVHPFYMQIAKDGSAHGVMLLNSNGMDVLLNETSLTYRVIGGLLDFYFFMGPSPEEVIRQYHQVIGSAAMMPYWTLGAHQAKWGYENISVAEAVVANYSKAGLPLECLFVDIEYMGDNFRTMTFNEYRYPANKMKAFAQRMHAAGQQWVPILNPGVGAQPGFKAYDEGTRDGIWLRDFSGKMPYLGQVWPGAAVFPDYLSSPNVTAWLGRWLGAFYEQAPFDGVWLDMNEASNFCGGMFCAYDHANATKMMLLSEPTPRDFNLTTFFTPRVTCHLKCTKPAKGDLLSRPPYRVHNSGYGEGRDAPFDSRIISPAARHVDGSLEYDAHNLFGTTQGQRHYEVLAKSGKRPFILSRSTFPGAGRYVAHWTGDNDASWPNFFYSIAGILNSNLWGIAMVGADICGFNDMHQDNKDWPPTLRLPDAEYEELCNRWTMAGAFYPFSRNHMMISHFSRSHEPYRWPRVTAAHKKAYGLRYQLLTYFYGSMFLAHKNGGTLARPLLFTDPSDLLARNATKQWMMGDALLVSPVLAYNTTTITPHFTAGTWYSAWNYSKLHFAKGGPQSLEVPLGDVAVHYRGGTIIPMQQYASVTRDVRFSPVTLVVTLPAQPSGSSSSSSGNATAAVAAKGPMAPYILNDVCAAAHKAAAGQLVSCGFLYQDNDTVAVSEDNTVQVWYTAATAPEGRSGTVNSAVVANRGDAAGKLKVTAVHLVGVPQQAAAAAPNAAVNGAAVGEGAAAYDAAAGVLKISGISQDVGQPFTLTWSL